MKNTNENQNFNRYFKILCIVWAFTTCYVMFYFVTNELYISRFEGPFLGYIELFMNNHIQLDNFNFFPLIDSAPIPVDTSFPNKIQGMIQSVSWLPNAVSIFIILCYSTGLPSHQLILLPLGIFFIPIAVLSLLKVGKSNITINKPIVLIGIYYIEFLIITRFYGSLYVAVFAMMLVLIILLCISYLFINRTFSKPFWIIFIISVFSLAQFWHSTLMMILFIMLSLFICIILFYILNIVKPFLKRSHIYSLNNKLAHVIFPLLLISSIISIVFSHIWESSYIEVVVDNVDLYGYFDILISKLSGKTAFPVPYVYSYKETFFGQLYFVSFIGALLCCSLILIISIIMQILHDNKKKVYFVNFPLIFGIALIISQMIQSILYYNTGSVNFPIVYLLFPIGALYLYAEITRDESQTNLIILYKKFFYGIVILLIILSGIMVITSNLTKEAGSTPLTGYDDTEPSFKWLYTNMGDNRQLIVDFNIFGKYIQREAQISKPTIDYIDLNPNIYGIWVGDITIIPTYLKNSISVVDKKTMSGHIPVQVTGSRAALSEELDRINSCKSLNKIYEDNSISLFKFYY